MVLFPEIQGQTTTSATIILAMRIPEDLSYFVGHFDAIPVVPGVVQIHWAVHYARQYFKIDQRFSHMEVIKFKELLLPNQHLQLDLHYQQTDCKLRFCYHFETTEYSSGRIYFHDNPI
jgi:3-hydroxymyristoyl/3-hydroxydecanoyl-(acyl carrier protein) dehydratase